jgi:hypothetical protein
MSEDMTYQPVTIVRCVRCAAWEQLAANQLKRIQALEAQLNAAIVGIEELNRQNAELRAKLDAVPMDDIQRMQGCEAHTEGTEWAKIRVREWLAKNGRHGMWPKAVQP